VGSSPTPGALGVDSLEDLINTKKQNNIFKSLQELLTQINSTPPNKEREEIEKEINLICKHQKQFIIKSLKKLLENSIENTKIICNHRSLA
jgi:folylpolyglutamate synthase/dihydropteroate synthase